MYNAVYVLDFLEHLGIRILCMLIASKYSLYFLALSIIWRVVIKCDN